ncbi:RagB/SusD family nutrient uptake outer membrane protein [Dyadobacter psychrotolerans]|uniref:RagB/SusD family nutrient uptake outer membrane protein n=1 Tax=Dyadobacter psychrotolerans TaxID=2541721 RepID=A0A4R5E164_9BACT|nr:RagB/SusD family nutrient uptake outer membrane protein [Dyadobacter psychrotolerans]TDE17423.1 RagB/SusD family nutrient uptake outer membrane protein [Dyadobacter psychrotolerans]
MKTLTKIFLSVLLITAVSCQESKFLEFDYYDGPVTEDQYWNLNSAARGQLNRGYTFLQEGYNRYGGAMLAAGSDEAVNSNLNSAVNIFNNGTWSSLRTIDDNYAINYNGIRQVNVFLENSHRANITPLNEVPRLRGEAFFLRAFFHFELLKRYGGVIIADRVFMTDQDLDLPRNSFQETLNQIIKDCDSAAVKLPLSPAQYGTGDRGRATKAAALALKSRALLYAASPLNNTANDATLWQKAAAASKELIDTKAHSLLASFANVFNFSNAAYNSEVIFATVANARNDIEINNAPISYNGASGLTNPTQELVDAFEMKNGLPISDPASGYSASAPYKDRDPRFALSVIYDGSVFKSVAVNTGVGGKDGIGQSVNATKTGYYMRKFLSDAASWNQTTNATVRRPWVLFRYAETLLNYAEAQNEAVGPDASVHDAINQIRKRAGMPNLPAGLTKDQMRLRIRNERRVELAFEEHRFFDIRRWKTGEADLGKAVTGMRITNTTGTPVYERFTVETRIFNERVYRYPIPQSEINNTTKLQQNPGY